MKQLIFFSLLSLCLIGCGKEDNFDPNVPEAIVGKWNLEKAEFVWFKNGSKDDDDVEIFAPGSYMEFTKDGNFTVHSMELGDDKFERFSGTYTYENKNLTVFADRQVNKFIVKKLEKKALIFEGMEEYEEEDDMYKDVVTFYLSR